MAAFALTMLILAAGVIATTIEARRANRRFNDVRQLAHSVLFDYHDAIAALPGSTGVRQRLVSDAQKYLSNLSAEAGNDRGLMREIADAYERIAAVQGGVALSPRTGTFLTSSNLGDAPGALENLHKASSLRERLARAEPANNQFRLELAFNYTVIGFVHVLNGPPEKAVEYLRKAIPMMESLLAAKPNDEYLQYTLWNAELGLAKSLGDPAVPNLGDWKGAMDLMRKCQPLIERLAVEHPSDPHYESGIGAQFNGYGQMYAGAGDDQNALESFQKALQIDQKLAQGDSMNAFYRRELAIQFGNVGGELLKLNDANGALENFKRSLAVYESMIATDPNDLAGLRNAGIGYRNIATALAANDPIGAMRNFQKTLEIFDRLVAKDPGNADFRRQQAYTHFLISRMQAQHDNYEAAVSAANQGIEIAEALTKSSPTNVSARKTLAELYDQSGLVHAAMATKASAEKQKSQWNQAKSSYQQSLDIYRDMKSQGKLSGADINKPEELAGTIAKCDEALNR
jgi:tetratricopeptide (TPR) repeat protein